MGRFRMFAVSMVLVVGFAVLPEQPAAGVQKKGWYEKAVKKIEAKFDPAEAKPGQTVTFKLTVDLNEGYHTYPTVQPDPAAEPFVNTIKYPEPGSVIFVGATSDPKGFETKSDDVLKIKELRLLSGASTFTRKVVVSPKASAGNLEVKLEQFRLQVCDKNNCFPSKAVPVAATLKVLDGPAVSVEKEFADEVKKALEK
jgi:hypothetical protein